MRDQPAQQRATSIAPDAQQRIHSSAEHGQRRLVAALKFLRAHLGELGFLYVGVIAPLLLFGMLAKRVGAGAGAPLPFDAPLMMALREWAWGGAESAALLLADIGYRWGVVPVDIAIVLGLLLFGRVRKGLFFAAAVGGAALLNVAAKLLFARMRPELWETIVDESSFSFPSGHAMGSMTLALGVVVLLWDTRWRWPALLLGLLFALAVSASRVWLGVHYPSDILAAWAAAAAWVFGVAHFFRLRRRKPSGEPVPTEPKHPQSRHDPAKEL